MEQKSRFPMDILISEWKPTRTLTIKYGNILVGMLPWTVTLSTAWRTSAMMKKKFPMKKDLIIRPAKTLGPGVVPFLIAIPSAFITSTFMKFFIESPIMFNDEKCPTCVQVRGGSIQCCTGVIVPYAATIFVTTFTSMVQLKQFKPPKIEPKDGIGRIINTFSIMKPLFKETGSMMWKHSSILGFSLVAQFVLNMFYVSQFQNEWFAIENILYEKSAILN